MHQKSLFKWPQRGQILIAKRGFLQLRSAAADAILKSYFPAVVGVALEF
jgi:hypothetical protein